jgi:hypothetical protein
MRVAGRLLGRGLIAVNAGRNYVGYVVGPNTMGRANDNGQGERRSSFHENQLAW